MGLAFVSIVGSIIASFASEPISIMAADGVTVDRVLSDMGLPRTFVDWCKALCISPETGLMAPQFFVGFGVVQFAGGYLAHSLAAAKA